MKAQFKVRSNLMVEVEGESETALFARLASVQEVFGEQKCGKCQSDDLRFIVRNVSKFTYYELRCQKCSARLGFGQLQDDPGSMFPRRKDDDEGSTTGSPNGWLPNGGWLKYDPEKKKSY